MVTILLALSRLVFALACLVDAINKLFANFMF